MYPLQVNGKEKQRPVEMQYQYLVAASEPKYVTAASRGRFGFRNRYLAKRSVLRTFRRIRRERV